MNSSQTEPGQLKYSGVDGQAVCSRYAETIQLLVNASSVYLIDSFLIPACDNIRIPRPKRYRQECYRGYTASKRRYFYGVKLYLLVTAQGESVEMVLAPGSTADVSAL